MTGAMKITREVLWRNPREIDRLLNEPIRANKITLPEPERTQWIREQTEARIEALFAEHHIPADWPELFQWERLARSRAGKLYPGCRTIERGRGGRRKILRLKTQERKGEIFEAFAAYRAQHPNLSATGAAPHFLRDNKPACDAAGLHTPRSFLKALRSMPKKVDTQTAE